MSKNNQLIFFPAPSGILEQKGIMKFENPIQPPSINII